MPALEPGSNADARSDADLILAIRAGEVDAIDELFRRHHRAAICFAESIAGSTLAPDLVSDAFLRILSLIERDGGPTAFFRSYLYTTIRNLFIDHVRRHARQTSLPDFSPLEAEFAHGDGLDDHFEHSLVKKAFSALPERWQIALWYTTVEGVPLEDAGRMLGVAPNAVAALTFRAREGLRQAYLAEHLSRGREQTCNEFWDLLPKYVRGSLRSRTRAGLEAHLDSCRACAAAVAELGEVNSGLRGVLLVALLGPTTAAHLDRALGPVTPTVASHPASAGHLVGRLLVAVGATAAVGVLVLAWPHHESARTTSAPRGPEPASSVTLVPRLPTLGPSTRRPPAPAVGPRALPPLPGATRSPLIGIRTGPVASKARPAVALGSSWNQLTETSPAWVHVGIAISTTTPAADLKVTIEASSWSAFHVHREPGYGPWACLEVRRGSVLSCRLPAGTLGPSDLGLDLRIEHPITLTVTAQPTGGPTSVTHLVVGD